MELVAVDNTNLNHMKARTSLSRVQISIDSSTPFDSSTIKANAITGIVIIASQSSHSSNHPTPQLTLY